MRAGPVTLKLVVETRGNLVDREAGSVCADDRAGAAVSGDFLQQAALDGEILGHGFDDPIGLGAPGKVVFEIADGDAVGRRGSEKGGGSRLLCGFETGANDTIADTTVGERQSAGILLCGELRGRYVEEPAVESSIGKMGGNAGTHGSGAKDGNTIELGAGFHRAGCNSLGLSARRMIGKWRQMAWRGKVSVTEPTRPVNQARSGIPKRAYPRLIHE